MTMADDPIPESPPQGAAAIAANTVGDQPTAQDSLGFAPYVEAIAAFLTSPATRPPLTMSIEGEWGSGKSSFMLQLERAIRGPSKTDAFIQALPKKFGGFSSKGSLWSAGRLAWHQRPRSTVQFNAWRHDKQDALWAAFALKFAKSLRKQIGVVRAWRGDISLFLRRLNGLRGWLELLLLVVSLVLLAIGAAGLYRFVKVQNGSELKKVITYLTATEAKTQTPSKAPATISPSPVSDQNNSEPGQPYRFLLSHGTWGPLLAIAIAGFVKFHKQVKLPLSVNLEKYLTKPDYQGRVAFIETFHEDFARLVEAYAKHKRIFVFVDDLDRCDVPRAAELMQAINLMIGDAGDLVFILGMDREKVAAGIVQKYKDLLPFIPEYAAAGSSQGNQTGALYFGYAYLEKFIQISFSLPVMSDQAAIRHFLSGIGSQPTPSTWSRRVRDYWSDQLKNLIAYLNLRNKPEEKGPVPHTETPPPSTAASSVAQEKRIKYLRIKVAEDSERIIDIVSMVSVIFENNPRKLKQFVNIFRLALYLGSDQGLLDQEDDSEPVTPEQLGKFVAITLRFPDLRSRLLENPDLLAQIEGRAFFRDVTPPDKMTQEEFSYRWLGQRGIRSVLLFGIQPGLHPFAPGTYSLKTFPVLKLLSILPRVPEKLSENRAASDVGGHTTESSGQPASGESVSNTVPFSDAESSSSQPPNSQNQSEFGDDDGTAKKGDEAQGGTEPEGGYIAQLSGDPERAIATAEKALAVARKNRNRQDEMKALSNLGVAYSSLADYRRAIQCYEESLAIAREIADRPGESQTLGNLANAYQALGETKRAIEYYEQSLVITRETADRRGEGYALWNLSRASEDAGDRGGAVERAESALKILEELKDPNAVNIGEQLDAWNARRLWMDVR
jgi:tetratricopeptide (TPR) repeat protein